MKIVIALWVLWAAWELCLMPYIVLGFLAWFTASSIYGWYCEKEAHRKYIETRRRLFGDV